MKLISLISQRPLGSVLVVAGICLLQPRTTTVAADSPTDAAPYLAAVRQFADQVLAHGRDVYGKPTPLFVDGLNVDTREPVKWKWADGKEWVLCNLANQQGLFRTLDGLVAPDRRSALQGRRARSHALRLRSSALRHAEQRRPAGLGRASGLQRHR